MSNQNIEHKINQIKDMENSNAIDIDFLKAQVEDVKHTLSECTVLYNDNSLESRTFGIMSRQVLPILGLLMDTITSMNSRLSLLEYNNIYNEETTEKVDHILTILKEK